MSRYYNLSWGRFISMDSIEYLDPESINGLTGLITEATSIL